MNTTISAVHFSFVIFNFCQKPSKPRFLRSTMFSFSTLHNFVFILLLLSHVIYSLPSNNRRYERDASSSLTKFPESGEFVLVLQNDESLEFEMCCTKSYGCDGSFHFCFETSDPKQTDEEKNGCGYGTCAYKIDYEENKRFSFSGDSFSTSDTCLYGKLSKEKVVVSYSGGKLSRTGCPLAVDVNNHLKLDIRSIPKGVTVTASNAEKYVEPTPSTAIPNNATESSQKEDEGMSDGVKYTLIGIGILLLVLILGGTAYGIHRWRKSKKTPKPAPKSTVSKAENQTPVKSENPTEQKEEATTKKKEHPRALPSTVVSSAEPQKPSKEPTASAEPQKQLQPSLEPMPSKEQQRNIPAELPKAPPTLADLVTRAERNGKRAKMGNTFDKTKKPFYENVFDSMLHCKWISEDDLPEQKKEKHLRPPSEDEILLFSLPIGDMFVKLEVMIDQALKRHKQHDEETPCKLITNSNVTYFVSHMAIVIHFAKFFNVQPRWEYSIPLSLAIAMDRTQSDAIRRHALVVMVQRAVDLKNFFTELECLKLPYPMNVLCLSFQYNHYLPQNVHRLHTFSSPNNSECTKSDGRSNGKHGTTAESVFDRGDGKEGSSSSKLSKATTMSKEIVVEKKKKGKRKR